MGDPDGIKEAVQGCLIVFIILIILIIIVASVIGIFFGSLIGAAKFMIGIFTFLL